MSRLSVADQNTGLDAILVTGTTYYLGVNTADPGITGANEMAGSTRQAIVFGTAASGGSKASTTAQTVPNPGTQPATHTSIWTLASGGVFKSGQVMASPTTSASLPFPVGAVVETLG